MTESVTDKQYMRLALRLARKGAGMVSPNPLVGAVMVRDGKILGTGYHQYFGGPHAEINAIKDAGGDVSGATLYCTLEPCSHAGKKTPPCAQRLVKEKIGRAVIAVLDPNPRVNGNGVRILKEAGIDVQTGLLGAACRELNRFFHKYITTDLPYVMVKMAQTLDGFIARERQQQSWITNSAVRRRVHKWRSEYDTVLIGAGTLKSDNPQLNVREVKGRNPRRIVLDRDLDADPGANIFNNAQSGKIILFCGKHAKTDKIHSIINTGAEVIRMDVDGTGRLALRPILRELHNRGIASVLVEGGQKIFTSFLSDDLADEIRIFIAPVLWGSGLKAVSDKINLDSFRLAHSDKLADNLLLTFLRKD